MKVLMVEPGKIPHEAEIELGLESLQAEVGGNIQAVYPYDDPVAMICNEEGKLMGLPLNRALTDDTGEVYDIIAGKFLIVGLDEESFGSLSDHLMKKYAEQFLYPEEFVKIEGKYLAIKQQVPATEVQRQQVETKRSTPVRDQQDNTKERNPQEAKAKAPKKKKSPEWER